MDYISSNITVYQCCDWVLLCSELLQESESTGRQQEQGRSPEQTGMYVCVEGGWGVGGCASMCVCVEVGGYVQSPEETVVCVCGGGGGACIWVCESG